MRTLIIFREGLSGNYLKALVDDSQQPVNFRMDTWIPGQKVRGTDNNADCVCLHKKFIDDDFYKRFDLTLTIQVRRRIYQAIYNNFYKKFLIENPDKLESFKYWKQDLVYWYDQTFYNMMEYYDLFQQDLVENTIENVIEFDQILDIDYIEQVFDRYYQRPLTANMQKIVEEYRALQLQYDLTQAETSMQDIVDALPESVFEESPWFASYCIFKYEKNNRLLESQRQWSINSVTSPIDRTFLLNIANQYS